MATEPQAAPAVDPVAADFFTRLNQVNLDLPVQLQNDDTVRTLALYREAIIASLNAANRLAEWINAQGTVMSDMGAAVTALNAQNQQVTQAMGETVNLAAR